jgi:hypothetical protein
MTRADATIPAAWTDVLAERRRQVTEEWWTPQHDDKHIDREMASAAATYALATTWNDEDRAHLKPGIFGSMALRQLWPWAKEWWKPTDRRRDLVKAGALILAEIERLDRAAAKEVAHDQG